MYLLQAQSVKADTAINQIKSNRIIQQGNENENQEQLAKNIYVSSTIYFISIKLKLG